MERESGSKPLPGATFGERVKQARRELTAARRMDVTQQEVADAVGVTNVTVGRWENDVVEPDLATIRRLAAVLRVPPGLLAFGDGFDRVEPIPRPLVAVGAKGADVSQPGAAGKGKRRA